MAKSIKRICPGCGEERLFRSDQKTCGCAGKSAAHEPDRVLHLRKEVSRLQTQLSSYQDIRGFQEELLESVTAAASALEPLPPQKAKSFKGSGSEVAAVIKFSDWHIGEVISESETEGFGRYNYAVAKHRAQYITENFLRYVETNRAMYKINKLYVFAEGDFISGDIHRELVATNEFPLPVQAVNAGALLAQSVATMAPYFSEVHLIEVGPDNHSRLQPKPQFKQKATNSMSYVVHAMANALLAKHGNVETLVGEGIEELVNVNGTNFLIKHGDTVKAWMGIPFYGMERDRGKEAVKRMQAMLDSERKDNYEKFKKDIGFDYISCGHWHVPGVVSGNILINGSMCGTTEFDHGCGRHARPSQVSFLVHPKWKLYNWVPWQVDR